MFDVTEIAKKKKGSKLKSSVRNYKKIRAGEVYAYDSKRDVVVAEKYFYPILFGEKNYKDYFGFISYKKLIIR